MVHLSVRRAPARLEVAERGRRKGRAYLSYFDDTVVVFSLRRLVHGAGEHGDVLVQRLAQLERTLDVRLHLEVFVQSFSLSQPAVSQERLILFPATRINL